MNLDYILIFEIHSVHRVQGMHRGEIKGLRNYSHPNIVNDQIKWGKNNNNNNNNLKIYVGFKTRLYTEIDI